MKPRPNKSTPEELISALPIVRQDGPTLTRLRAELRLLRRLIAVPMAMGIFSMVWIIGVGALMLVLMKANPALMAQSEQSGTPMRVTMLLWFAVIPISFLGSLGMPVVLPFWIDGRIRGREALFCDTQLIGDLIDLGQAINSSDSSLQRGWYAGCVLAWLTRLLPEVGAREAAALTNRQRDFLVERALAWQSAQEAFVLAVLRSAPVWGDIETLTAVLMLSRTAESDAIRAAAHSSLSPLKVRLQTQGENAALIHSLGIPSAS